MWQPRHCTDFTDLAKHGILRNDSISRKGPIRTEDGHGWCRGVWPSVCEHKDGEEMTLDEFFEGYDEARILFEAVCRVIETIGPAKLRVTKSQIAFHRRRAFAWAWTPGRYLRCNVAPLVLTLSFRSRDPSPRWKQVIEAYPGRFTHHLELYSLKEIDEEVRDWLRNAWETAN